MDVGSARQGLLLASLLFASAGFEFRQSAGAARRCSTCWTIWLRLGVDGVRLDAVPYLFEREGTNCENLPETHEFLKKLRQHVDERFPGRMLLGRGESVAGGRDRLFRQRRRMPHGVSLPGHAAVVHGDPDGGSLSDHRHPAADAADSGELPVGSSSCATTTS